MCYLNLIRPLLHSFMSNLCLKMAIVCHSKLTQNVLGFLLGWGVWGDKSA